MSQVANTFMSGSVHFEHKEIIPASVPEEESSEDDSEAELLDSDTERQFFAVMKALKGDSESLLDGSKKFFANPEEAIAALKTKDSSKQKKLTILEYQHARLKQDGYASSDDEKASPNTHISSQEHPDVAADRARQAAIQAVALIGTDSDESDGLEPNPTGAADGDLVELPVPKEVVQEALSGGAGVAEGVSVEDARFLQDYVLKNQWKERAKKLEAIELDSGSDSAADEDFFEGIYNFRHMEEGMLDVEVPARDASDTYRRTESKRAAKRRRKAERKKALLKQRSQSIREDKNRMKEKMASLLGELNEMTGGRGLDIIQDQSQGGKVGVSDDASVLLRLIGDQGSFDEEKHQELMDRMQEAVDADDTADIDSDGNPIHPVFSDLEEDVAQRFSHPDRLKRHDVDDVSDLQDQIRSIDQNLSVEDKASQIRNMIEKYYSLDYEDIVGGQKVRYKYVDVEPCDFGLSIDDILELDDKDLNSIVSIKKLATYRDDRDALTARYKSKKQRRRVAEKVQQARRRIAANALDDSGGQKRSRTKVVSVGEPIESSQSDLPHSTPIVDTEVPPSDLHEDRTRTRKASKRSRSRRKIHDGKHKDYLKLDTGAKLSASRIAAYTAGRRVQRLKQGSD